MQCYLALLSQASRTAGQGHNKFGESTKTHQGLPARGAAAAGSHSPAAKCRGEDFLPAVSLAFTFCGVTSFFTLTRSPFLHASKSSRSGSFPEISFCEAKADLLEAIVPL
ncbi:hypothetical protein E2C01_010535 [Portunus trituberculatus]|uniref:Uncharacterized protein n=1 Tax=Portunus trituberculatus TaxID=210409 RepID=A0A5B7D8M1_PORTR|nr:hypothetical protein [Portunus trituberculatus]